MSRMSHTPETEIDNRPETRPDGPHSMMRRPAGSLSIIVAAIAALAFACGGKQGSDPEQPGEETSARGADDGEGEDKAGESEGGEEIGRAHV